MMSLRAGTSLSCGCLRNERVRESCMTHGFTAGGEQPEYYVWVSMVARCTNPKNTAYHRYGGRGIRVCRKWRSFSGFIEDMGRRPTPAHTLERRDNNKGYHPGNVRWATRVEQANNTSRTRPVTIDGVAYTSISAASRSTGIPEWTIRRHHAHRN